MKKIIASFVLTFLMLSLSGCWNYKELNEYAIVTGIAIDKIEDKYEFSVLISNTPKSSTDSSSSESKIVVYSGEGSSIFEAVKDVGLISPKELYLGGFSILVISEDVARDGVYNAIDFFLRYSSSRNNFYVVVAKDTKAKNTLKIMTSITNFPSQNISDNLKATTNLQGIVKTVNFDELTSTLLRDGVELTLNYINIIGDIEKGESQENMETSSPNAYVKIGNLSVFKDDKLLDFASHTESVGINIINGDISEMYLNIECDNGYVVVDTTTLSSNIKVNIENNEPNVDISVKGEAKIIEVSGNINLQDSKVIEQLQNKANELIVSYINEAISLAKKNNSDIFGIGRKFYQNHPNYFNNVKDNWDNIFLNIKFNSKSDLILKNKVASKNSLEVTDEK